MKYPFFFSLLLGFAILILPASVSAHGDEVPVGKATADHFTVYGVSDKYEITLYYPELSAGKEAHLTLYLADFHTNRPIDKAVLKISSPEAAGLVFETKPMAPGIYEVHAIFPENKAYSLLVQVEHPNGADLIGMKSVEVGKALPVHSEESAHQHSNESDWWLFLLGLAAGGGLVYFITRNKNRTLTAVILLFSAWLSNPGGNPVMAHGDDDHGPKGGGTGYGKSVFAPKEAQFLFEVTTEAVAIGDYHAASDMFGTVIPASGGMGAVLAPQSGRITRLSVAVGQSVRAGQVLAVLQQNLNTAEQVGVAASNSGLSVHMEAAKTRLAAVKREWDRLKKIEDIAAGKEVQAAEAAYNQALAEWQTLETKAAGAYLSANNKTLNLVAPISGVVGTFTLAPGAEVVAGQTLFTVTNLHKVYVEAQVYDRDVPSIEAGNKFLVTCSTDDHKSAEVRLISQAQTMNPGNQSQRVLFELDNPHGDFKIGEFVTVKAMENNASRQLTVPNAALTEINGRPAVFLKHAPEEFELAYVQTGKDDGTRTLVLKGFEEGEKVVVNGVYEVKMMYLNQ